jgi:hypothetical protein
VLFFWAGKTSPRELEEFVKDLVDGGEEETLLAFSLLADQGDRLAHEMRRALALRLLQHALPGNGSVGAVAHPPAVPTAAYAEIHANTIYLRGLSERSTVVHVLASWLESGILAPKDMPFGRADSRDAMTVAVLWALSRPGTCMTLDARHSVEHLSPQQVSLLCFEAITWSATTVDSLRDAVAEWLTAFPANRHWMPLLLAGAIAVGGYAYGRGPLVSDRQKRIWPVLWEWRNETVASDWLQESDECWYWRGERSFDLLTSIREMIASESHNVLGVSAAQHEDLLLLCDRLLAKREVLKASITGASTA